MPGTHTHQTKRMIEKLLKSDFKRSDFRVRTPTNHRGEYKDTRTTIWKKEKIPDRLDKMLNNGINVTEYIIGSFIHYKVEESLEEKGTHKIKKIR